MFANDLDDDLDDLLGGGCHRPVDTTLADVQPYRMTHDEPCPACRGSGKFRSYSGRIVGDCFKCKGKGVRTFRTTLEQRTKSREAAERARQRKALSIAEQAHAWRTANPAEAAWIAAKRLTFGFASNMADALEKYGSLTEKQHATVTRLMEADAARDEARRIEREQRLASAQAVDISAIERAFAEAIGRGVRSPKLRLDTFTFSPAKATSNNPGAIYVREGEAYLGKIVGGKLLRVRECSADQEARIVAAAADPRAAAIAYGQRFGSCSICGRELTKGASIDRGIGPICAEKYGF